MIISFSWHVLDCIWNTASSYEHSSTRKQLINASQQRQKWSGAKADVLREEAKGTGPV